MNICFLKTYKMTCDDGKKKEKSCIGRHFGNNRCCKSSTLNLHIIRYTLITNACKVCNSFTSVWVNRCLNCNLFTTLFYTYWQSWTLDQQPFYLFICFLHVVPLPLPPHLPTPHPFPSVCSHSDSFGSHRWVTTTNTSHFIITASVSRF